GGARPWRPGRRAPGREDRVRTGGTGAGGGVPAGRGGRCSGASAARRRDGRRATLMLFRVDPEQQRLRSVPSDWLPQELELEKLIVTTEDGETPILDDAVFGEQLLVLRRQVSTRTGKRADILALDRAGRLVVVELKRNAGRLGVETQALQYPAGCAPYPGERCISRCERDQEGLAGLVRGFLGDDVPTQELNRKSRVILVARSFDLALFSMGEWL